jgi:hypothetical protein
MDIPLRRNTPAIPGTPLSPSVNNYSICPAPKDAQCAADKHGLMPTITLREAVFVRSVSLTYVLCGVN